MKYQYNSPNIKNKRRHLRKNMTETEVLLWSRLKGRQLGGYKFRRQYSVGSYILDFYCPSMRLAVEVDGGPHNLWKNRAKNEKRTKYLEKHDITVIRFWNNEIFENLEDVLNAIWAVIDEIQSD